MPIYLQYAKLTGDVTAAGHEKWIEVSSFQWGVGRGISSPTGGAANRESSAPSVSEITMSHTSDSASLKLLDEALEGEGADVTIDFVKTDKGKLEVYLTYTLTDTMVSGYSISSGGDRPQESISLNFTKIQCKFTEQTAAGAGGTQNIVTYDIGQAKTV